MEVLADELDCAPDVVEASVADALIDTEDKVEDVPESVAVEMLEQLLEMLVDSEAL